MGVMAMLMVVMVAAGAVYASRARSTAGGVDVAWVLGTAATSLGLLAVGLRFLLQSMARAEREVLRHVQAETAWRTSQQDVERQFEGRIAKLQRDKNDISRLQRELARANAHVASVSHRAGRAEVANSVLHNVGNVLNSVSVSASLLADQANHSALKDLPRAIELALPILAASPSATPQGPAGTDVGEFLRMLSQQWELENAQLLRETTQLRHQVGHIREIVTRQQTMSGPSGTSQALHLPDVMRDVLSIHEDEITRHGVDVVQTRMDADPWLGDRNKLTQIMLNLVINAQEALAVTNATRPQIALRGEITADGGLELSVSDNGVGMDSATLSRLFTLGHTTKSEGHGIGLHFSAIAAQEMGGRLTAASPGLGQGATFTLSLPPPSKRQPRA